MHPARHLSCLHAGSLLAFSVYLISQAAKFLYRKAGHALGLLILSCAAGPLAAQVSDSDDINVDAVFRTMIDLRLDQAGTVYWEFSTIEHYTEGYWPVERRIRFSVSASVSFGVQFVNTPMTDGAGNEIAIWNFGFRFEPHNGNTGYSTRFVWAPKDGINEGPDLSGIYLASLSPKTVILPGPAGNAGDYDQNSFWIRVGIASPNIRSITGRPTLLEQNIKPGTYVSVLTLTAFATP